MGKGRNRDKEGEGGLVAREEIGQLTGSMGLESSQQLEFQLSFTLIQTHAVHGFIDNWPNNFSSSYPLLFAMRCSATGRQRINAMVLTPYDLFS